MCITTENTANKSEFGRGTVFGTLSDEPFLVKKGNREKITKVIRRCGYVKNEIAMATRKSKDKDRGLMIPAMFILPFCYGHIKLIAGMAVCVETKEKSSDILNKIGSFRLSGLTLAPDWRDWVYVLTMSRPVTQMGELAVDIVARKKECGDERHEVVEAELLERGSCSEGKLFFAKTLGVKNV